MSRQRVPMLINYGYEITFAVAKPTPVICLLDVHPSRRADVMAETPFRTTPSITSATYIDAFGNQCRRLLAPAGETTL
ncbi:MAG: transglutaminase family protein, partial [Hyphomicrobium sp.]